MSIAKVFLTLIPFVWTIGGISFANRTRPFVLGVPFLMFWMLAGILLAFICLMVMYKIDTDRQKH